MEALMKGDIVVLPFPFSDLSGFKSRPAVIVADMQGDDVVLCQITGTQRDDDYTIHLDDYNFIHGNLQGESLIRANKIFTIDKRIIFYKVGMLKDEKLKEVKNKIVDLIRR